jgi:toxin FitB
MILLDTNVISEFLKPEFNQNAALWLEAQDRGALYLSTVTIAEIAYGVSRLQDGKRKTRLEEKIRQITREDFAQRVLPLDGVSAWCSGEIRVRRERVGKPVSLADAAIAATAITHGLSLATRNIRDFEGLDLKLINPFEDAA